MAKTSKMPKHGKAFAREYVKNGRNGTKAALTLPGITTENSAAVLASNLLRNDKVQAEIARLEKKLEERTLITKERVLKELAVIGFADMKDYVEVLDGGIVHIKPWKELPPDATRAVSKVKEKKTIRADGEGDGEGIVVDNSVEFAHHDKIKALAEISKLQGYYPKEELDVNHKGSVSLVHETDKELLEWLRVPK